LNVPEPVGVPLIVIVLEAHEAVTPAGKPVAVPIPLAPVVVWVMLVMALFKHPLGEADAAETVLGFGQAARSEIKIPPIIRGFVLTTQLRLPNPVAPGVGSNAQAAPTAGLLAVTPSCPLSYNSVSAPKVAVVQEALS
jgi:hypothetical protein